MLYRLAVFLSDNKKINFLVIWPSLSLSLSLLYNCYIIMRRTKKWLKRKACNMLFRTTHVQQKWRLYWREGNRKILYRSSINSPYIRFRILLVKMFQRILLYKRISFVWKMFAALFASALTTIYATEIIRE